MGVGYLSSVSAVTDEFRSLWPMLRMAQMDKLLREQVKYLPNATPMVAMACMLIHPKFRGWIRSRKRMPRWEVDHKAHKAAKEIVNDAPQHRPERTKFVRHS